MSDQDKILQFLKVTGPTTPSKVAKNIGQDSIIASAHLSDLKSQGKIKISNLKLGSTPLYYLEGQEGQLYDFADGNINPKDFIVLEELKKQKILREKDLELIGKVALRKLKDFAIPLHVSVKGVKELFWKWHLLPAPEANTLIKDIFFKDEKKIPVKEQPVEKVEPITITKKESDTEKEEVAETKKEEVVESKSTKETPDTKKEEVVESKLTKKKTTKPKTKPKSKLKTKKQTVLVEKEDEKEEEKKEEPDKKTIIQKVKEKITPKKRKIASEEFLPAIHDFFQDLEIKIDQKETVRKNTELNFYVIVPSVVGKIKYFCKAKKKNRCDEKDLSAAYMEAQSKKLPLLFLYTNEMNKKAEEMLDSGAFENVVVRKIE